MQVFGIEGLDRLGKSTLIEGILQQRGYYEVIHFSKPKILDAYAATGKDNALYLYQHETFLNSMLMAKSGARIIFDRWHLGECVYAPLYRNYDGDYVFNLEEATDLHLRADVRLILLTEDFDRSTHFKSDGDSFDDGKRRDEQELFLEAYHKSKIRDKRIICVTARDGGFRSKEEILRAALT